MIQRLLILLFLNLNAGVLVAQSYSLATYNIRGDMAKDAPANTWQQRKVMIPDLIRFHDFDVFGVQEGDPNQLNDLQKALPEYTLVAEGKNNGQNGSAIFFKTQSFQLKGSNNFWLSPNPDKKGKAWDAKFARGCTWVSLKDVKSGKTFFYFNTHLDHVGVMARKNSTSLLLNKVKEIAGDNAAALGGDFNFSQYDENYAAFKNSGFLQDAWETTKLKYAPNGTFNGFNITRNSDERIDHIFLSEKFKVERYGILTDNFGGKLPSDHFPVMIVVENK
ncbi:endonuclease/exonuclease/phosphatase family protein [Pedobacter sp. MC2016-14]|uniref:endonuclease/exonuclease/phosphatase family protein n=1 Tax=Pedobacter sp. MC2016-14 TaxID=2897327 RepID=UPI001E558F10|nr:endonuclease/exonuclease/phosphatase family protein [Pedobacter sp. MC2016-14]MCD0488190.1 endonuclease/exonuclease/phosphatase family protein [Pedobacter sp. MC2016-14]